MSEYLLDDVREERFSITDDSKALWAIGKIKAHRAEKGKLVAFYQEQIARITADADEREAFFLGLLEPYFDTLPKKASKTQESYALPGATLVRKARAPKYEQDNVKLVAFLKAAGRTDCIKVKEEASWADYKPLTTILDGKVVDTETGEIVAGVTVEERGPKFEVKIDG